MEKSINFLAKAAVEQMRGEFTRTDKPQETAKEFFAKTVAEQMRGERSAISINRRVRALELAIAHGQSRANFPPQAIIDAAELFLAFLNAGDLG